MTTSKAIKVLEDRVEYLETKNSTSFVASELSALNVALDVLTEKLLADRVARSARYAMRQHLPGASC